MYSLYLVAALFVSCATSSIIPIDLLKRQSNVSPFRYAALGDSFGSGHGAGKFIPEEEGSDGNNNKCARGTGSYPYQTKGFLPTEISDFAFYACSGGLMKHVDGQVSQLLGNKFDVISLSISGNDFDFGSAVEFCVYPYRGMTNQPDDAQEGCDDHLDAAEAAINGESKWEEFRSKVQLVQGSLVDGGHIYITGYAKFFSPDGTTTDACSKRSFFQSEIINKFASLLNMTWENRKRMNDLVDKVNQRIQDDVVAKVGGNVHFIDIDAGYAGKRFCEVDKNPWGAGPDDVWMNDLNTQLQVDDNEKWEGPAFPDSESFWVAPGNVTGDGGVDQLTDDDLTWRGLHDEFQKRSAFHPKTVAHKSTAAQLTYQILTQSNNFAGDSLVRGPDQICMGFSPGGGDTCFDIPEGCVSIRPIDNTVPEIFCEDGRDVSS